MARDKLDTLLRLRRLAVQDRIRALAAAMRTEDQACRAQAACAQALVRETAEARTMAQRDAALAGFVPWRARATQALRDAEAQVTHAGEATRTAQAMLGAWRDAGHGAGVGTAQGGRRTGDAAVDAACARRCHAPPQQLISTPLPPFAGEVAEPLRRG
jgi:hypothetical protein